MEISHQLMEIYVSHGAYFSVRTRGAAAGVLMRREHWELATAGASRFTSRCRLARQANIPKQTM